VHQTAQQPSTQRHSTATMPTTLNHLGQPIGQPLKDWTPPRFPSREPLLGQFCRVEPLDPERHANDLFAVNAEDLNGRSWTYLPYGPFRSVDEYREWLEGVSRTADPLFFAIIDKAGGRPVGVASYLRITPASGSIEVGHIHFSDRLKQTAVATEAMFLMMQKVFELGYRRYEWKCDALNAPSCAAAERLGFSYEGTFRQATVYKGRNRDTAWYAVIDADWPALRLAFLRWLDADNFDVAGRQRLRLRELTRELSRP
jgi:RimJ/RimL family protein N-acetyltransferase